MRTTFFTALPALLLTLAAWGDVASWGNANTPATSPHPRDCCSRGADCCNPPQECCFSVDCCATGADCCDPPQACCAAAARCSK